MTEKQSLLKSHCLYSWLSRNWTKDSLHNNKMRYPVQELVSDKEYASCALCEYAITRAKEERKAKKCSFTSTCVHCPVSGQWPMLNSAEGTAFSCATHNTTFSFLCDAVLNESVTVEEVKKHCGDLASLFFKLYLEK